MLPTSDGGYNVVYACHRFELAPEFLRLVKKVALLFNLVLQDGLINDPREGKDLQGKAVYFANGNSIRIVPANPDALRGWGQGRCLYILDEFAHMPNPRESLKSAMAALTRFGRVIIISTHFGEDTVFNELVTGIEGGKLDPKTYGLYKTTLVDACRDGYFRKTCDMFREVWTPEREEQYILDMLSQEGAEEEYLCVPVKVGSTYFYKDKVEQAMNHSHRPIRISLTQEFMGLSESSRTEQVHNWFTQEVSPILFEEYHSVDSYYGQDFARSPIGDLSVIALLRVEEDLTRGCPLMIEMRGMPYPQQEQIAKRIAKETPRLVHMSLDDGGNGNFLGDSLTSHLGESFVTKVHFGPKTYGEMLPRLKAGIESGNLWIPASADLLGDFMKIVRKEGSPVLPRTKESDGIGYRHGDTVVALMMAYSDSISQGKVDYSRVRGYKDRVKKRRGAEKVWDYL